MSRCKSCGAEIVWAKTQSGASMPLDAEPIEIPRGLFYLLFINGEGKTALAAPKLRRSHFATCPDAEQHRKT